MAVPLMCCAADMLCVPSRKQVVLVGLKSSADFENMLAAAHASYDPNKTVSRTYKCKITTVIICTDYPSLNSWQVIHIDPTDTEELEFWAENNNKIASMARSNLSADKVVALVCQNFTCSPPVTEAKMLENMLSSNHSSKA